MISFLDLIDVVVAYKLINKGVKIASLRKAYINLENYLDTSHPFSRCELHTDGQHVFLHAARRIEDDELYDLVDKQQTFPKILLPFLDHIEYDENTRLARLWRIGQGVVIDPERKFGKPIVESCALPTEILAASYNANNHDLESTADWFGVEPEDVLAAARFEQRIKKRAA